MPESLIGGNNACKDICMNTLRFLHDVSITLIDKTNPSRPTKHEDI